METNEPIKPAAQVLGASSVEPTPIVLTPEEPIKPGVNWFNVAKLPPFQMYVHEQAPCPPGRCQQEWATDYAVRYAGQIGDEALLNAYADWHAAKGYWPNETPFGEVKQG